MNPMNQYFDILNQPLEQLTPAPSNDMPTVTTPLTMAYVAAQPSIEPVYDDAKALMAGTLYPELDKPFMKGRLH